MNWIDLSPWWDRLEALGNGRDDQKRSFKSSLYFNDNSHFLGLCGEQALAVECDLEVKYDLLLNGDGGEDFDNINVKGVSYWADPWLKEFVPPKHTTRYYVLAGVDVDNKRAWLRGFVIRADLFLAPIKDWGHGPRYSLHHTDSAFQPIEALKRVIRYAP